MTYSIKYAVAIAFMLSGAFATRPFNNPLYDVIIFAFALVLGVVGVLLMSCLICEAEENGRLKERASE